jgi:hypothetical protein
MDDEVTITVTPKQAVALRRLVKTALKKAERQYDDTFVPAPGKRHSGQLKVMLYRELLERLPEEVVGWKD